MKKFLVLMLVFGSLSASAEQITSTVIECGSAEVNDDISFETALQASIKEVDHKVDLLSTSTKVYFELHRSTQFYNNPQIHKIKSVWTCAELVTGIYPKPKD